MGRMENMENPMSLEEMEKVCEICREPIDVKIDHYSQDWKGAKKVWVHNKCAYEHPEALAA